MLLAAIPGQPNAYGALAFFVGIPHFIDFWPLGPSPLLVDLGSNAIIGIEIGEIRSKYEIWQ